MNWLLVIFLLILVWRVVQGFKRGMVKEIVSLLSLIIASVTIILLGTALISYFEKDIVSMVVAVLLLIILAVIHKVLNLVFFSAKVLAKLPVIHSCDKLLGVLAGAVETVVLIWVVFTLLINFDTGSIGQQILSYVGESRFLTFLYEHNYLVKWVRIISDKIAVLPMDILK